MTFSTIIEDDFVTLRVEGNHVPAEVEPHGEFWDEHFEDVAVYVVDQGGAGGTDSDITDLLSEKQYAALEAVLMQEWRSR